MPRAVVLVLHPLDQGIPVGITSGYIYIYMFMYVYIYICMYICIYVCIYIYTCMMMVTYALHKPHILWDKCRLWMFGSSTMTSLRPGMMVWQTDRPIASTDVVYQILASILMCFFVSLSVLDSQIASTHFLWLFSYWTHRWRSAIHWIVERFHQQFLESFGEHCPCDLWPWNSRLWSIWSADPGPNATYFDSCIVKTCSSSIAASWILISYIKGHVSCFNWRYLPYTRQM